MLMGLSRIINLEPIAKVWTWPFNNVKIRVSLANW